MLLQTIVEVEAGEELPLEHWVHNVSDLQNLIVHYAYGLQLSVVQILETFLYTLDFLLHRLLISRFCINIQAFRNFLLDQFFEFFLRTFDLILEIQFKFFFCIDKILG